MERTTQTFLGRFDKNISKKSSGMNRDQKRNKYSPILKANAPHYEECDWKQATHAMIPIGVMATIEKVAIKYVTTDKGKVLKSECIPYKLH